MSFTVQCSGEETGSPSDAGGEAGVGGETQIGGESHAGGDATVGGNEPGSAGAPAECGARPLETYERRIEPLFLEDNPKSCNQCHLSGVDLSNFARSTPCETMACLVEQGLVDLEAPDQSKILGWIQRASPDSDLITDAVIQAEYDGFLEWIQASAECPEACEDVACEAPEGEDRCANEPNSPGAPAEPAEPPGCSDAAIEQSFFDNVYASRGRCFPCHHSDQLNADPAAPRWIRTEGNCAAASLATLRRVTGSGYIDVESPEQSLLLLKPLAESAGGVVHGGHDKFADTNDPAYVRFLQFIRTYAACNAPAP